MALTGTNLPVRLVVWVGFRVARDVRRIYNRLEIRSTNLQAYSLGKTASCFTEMTDFSLKLTLEHENETPSP